MIKTDVVFDPDTQSGDPCLDGEAVYVYEDRRIVLAVRIALATGRPLLVTGNPGSGKSSLAADVARRLSWAYVETVVTSRTRLSDLVAEVDLVKRLNDAQANALNAADYGAYLVPGVLWWAFDPDSARQAPLAGPERRVRPSKHPDGVVVLLDEIDKAEPDLPNDLLGPLGSGVIDVPHRGRLTSRTPLLVIITSNREREMPPAFLRRCLHLELDDPKPEVLKRIAESRWGERDDELYLEVAQRLEELQKAATRLSRRVPSTAEFLDAVDACRELDVRPGDATWSAIEEVALRKTRSPRSGV